MEKTLNYLQEDEYFPLMIALEGKHTISAAKKVQQSHI